MENLLGIHSKIYFSTFHRTLELLVKQWTCEPQQPKTSIIVFEDFTEKAGDLLHDNWCSTGEKGCGVGHWFTQQERV